MDRITDKQLEGIIAEEEEKWAYVKAKYQKSVRAYHPQKRKDTYREIPCNLLGALLQVPLNKTDLKVFLYLMDLYYGFEAGDRFYISNKAICIKTRADKRKVKRAISKLLQMEMISITGWARSRNMFPKYRYRINPYFESWKDTEGKYLMDTDDIFEKFILSERKQQPSRMNKIKMNGKKV